MTIFDYLKDIMVNKTGKLPLDNYVPYLVTRWLSFIDPAVAQNLTHVSTPALLEDKASHYKMMLCLFPKLARVPKIQYIKKLKEESTEQQNKMSKYLAQAREISIREAEELLHKLK